MDWINEEEFNYLLARLRVVESNIRYFTLRQMAGMDDSIKELKFQKHIKAGINKRLEAYCLSHISITQLQKTI